MAKGLLIGTVTGTVRDDTIYTEKDWCQFLFPDKTNYVKLLKDMNLSK